MTDENEEREEQVEEEDKSVTSDDESGGVQVRVDDDEDKGDDGEKPLTRAEKKRQRGRLLQEHEETKRERDELRDRVARLEGVLGRSMVDSQREERAARESEDPTESELADIYDQQQTLAMQIEALGKNITKEQLDRFTEKARKLDIRKHELISERTLKKTHREPSEDEATKRWLQVQFRDVYANPEAAEWAKGYYFQKKARTRRGGVDLVVESLEEARKEFGMARSQPTETQQRRFSGVTRGAGAAAAPKSNTVTLNKAQMKMADTQYSHIKDKNERYKMWAKKAGKRLMEKAS